VDAPTVGGLAAQTGVARRASLIGEAPIEARRNNSAELTTPALRASPPLRGGE